ncbi:MAG: SIR2 family protein [Pseudomonadales bacterium]|nr:SIR2 family protein [Pseudomonadales bacterium]
MDYSEYRDTVSSTIQKITAEFGCQPILFIGSGASRRYFNAPTWDALLEVMVSQCPLIPRKYGYYRQKHSSLPEVGSEIAELYRDWAWQAEGNGAFPASLMVASLPSDTYLKYKVSQYLKELTPSGVKSVKPAKYRKEIESLQEMQPHAVISTNYDGLLEIVFPDFEPVIGQRILRANYVSVGEIFKIHGCVSDPSTLVLTSEDYQDWGKKKKYLSAKLLTYFAEHPMLFFGYGAGDANIRGILSDIDEILSGPDGLVQNLFFLNYVPSVEDKGSWPMERIVELDDGRSIRIQNIDAEDFLWVFDSFRANSPIQKVNPKLLRALLARNYELVRHDIPRKTVEVNFQTLEHVVMEEGRFAHLLGISTLNNPQVFNAYYPYTLTGVANQLGYDYWSHANQLIGNVKESTGIDIKSFDNKYHVKVKVGNNPKSVTNKYSDACVELLRRVRDGERYQLDTTEVDSPSK